MIGKTLMILAGVIVGLLLLGALAQRGETQKTFTYADLADDLAKRCIRNKGDGQWRGSLGVTLQDFCRAAGALEARQQMCKAYPENC